MARYQINLAYDGTEFLGYQRQGTKGTVQRAIESALKELGWDGRAILSAGRTDTGVHAAGQVAAFDLEWKHSTKDLKNALNAKLPDGISLLEVREADKTFHPRFNALARSYRYSVFLQSERNPLRERYAWRIEQPVDLKLLELSAKELIGLHDFSEFGRAMKKGNTTVRTVFSARWKKRTGGTLEFDVVADAFLYHMVRRMVYLQILVGQGRLSMEDFRKAVWQAKKVIPGMAPAHGLCLMKIFYKADWQKDWNMNRISGKAQYPSI